jgi:hypothetical protein
LAAFETGFTGAANAHDKCYNGLFVVLLADQLDKPKRRDEVLATLVAIDDAQQARSRKLAALLQRALKEEGPLSLQSVRDLSTGASPEEGADLFYFAGWYLQQHGRREEATTCFEQSVLTKASERLTYQLAQMALPKARQPSVDPSPAKK